MNRDPIEEEGFTVMQKRSSSQDIYLFAILAENDHMSEDDEFNVIDDHYDNYPNDTRIREPNIYVFSLNQPVLGIDVLGLSFRRECESFADCWRRCIETYYGASFSVALGLTPFGLAQGIQEVYNGVVQAAAQRTIENASIAGALRGGNMWRRRAAAQRAATQARRLRPLTRVLSGLGRASNVVGAAAFGYVVGASGYCAVECR